ncbi:MAG: hypothetical protein ACTHMZ_15540, partial [Actinomycetes bacterium]
MDPAPNAARVPLRRALVSVYDKTGLEELARALHQAGVAIVSTGSTAARIEQAGVPVTKVEELTGFPECLDGRVKTLHPKVHAGLLADLRLESHQQQLADLGVEPFQLVVSNLYPFTQTVASGASPDECVEQIDIGGPSMVRAAAKNHANVAVVTDPSQYGAVREALRDAGVPVTPVEELTGFPECLDGRVKTLHPKVHAGILADLRKPEHEQQLGELGVEPFDLVVVNLYPFVETVFGGATPDECVEQIDIGGPSMVRAAAKNHPSVAVVVEPSAYPDVIAAIDDAGFTLQQRQQLAAKAFQHTASYDLAVASWMSSVL